VTAGIGRFKMHLAGGYGDAVKCPKPPPIVQREMIVYLKKNTRNTIVALSGDGEQEQEKMKRIKLLKLNQQKYQVLGQD